MFLLLSNLKPLVLIELSGMSFPSVCSKQHSLLTEFTTDLLHARSPPIVSLVFLYPLTHCLRAKHSTTLSSFHNVAIPEESPLLDILWYLGQYNSVCYVAALDEVHPRAITHTATLSPLHCDCTNIQVSPLYSTLEYDRSHHAPIGLSLYFGIHSSVKEDP